MTLTSQQVADAIDRGEMTVTQAVAMFQAEADAATHHYTPPPPASSIAATGMSASQLAVRSLIASGQSEIDALRTVSEKGVESFATEIAAESEKVVALLTASTEAAFSRSSEGRRQAAEQLELKDAQHTRTVQLGRRLLEEQGVTDDDLDSLSPAEIISASGIEGATDTFNDGGNDRAANLAAMKASDPNGGTA